MKDDKAVQEALKILKENAETDFEKLSVARLETALNNPPRVEIIDDTHQKFNGNTYYKSKRHGHYYDSVAIHQAVYEYYNGNIPYDMNIHHVDENKDNNDIENLMMMTRDEHAKLHMITQQKEKYTCLKCGKEFYAAFRGTNSGFCPKCRAQKNHKPFKDVKVEKVCVICGKKFETRKYRSSKACSPHCGAILAHMSRQEGKKGGDIK